MMTLLAISNKDIMFYVLMGVLIAFIVLLIVLAILLIVQIANGQQQKAAPVIVAAPAAPAPVRKKTRADELPERETAEEEPVFMYDIAVPEVAAEEVAEGAPVEEEQPAEEEEVIPLHIVKEIDEEGSEEIIVEGRERVRYDKSFTAKLIQLDDTSKEWYSKLKNFILSYDRVSARTSWKRESFRIGKETVIRFSIRGKTLCAQLALDPAKYAESKYKVEDISDISSAADTPCLYRIKNLRRKLYCKELIAEMMESRGVKKFDRPMEDYCLPYDGTVGLMQRGLIKRVVSTENKVYHVQEVNGERTVREISSDKNTNPFGRKEIADSAAETNEIASEAAATESKD